jgi:hypothetical protein
VKKLIRQAFETVHNGYSADRILADPELNARFLAQCALLGLTAAPQILNSALLNSRKASVLTGIRTKQLTRFPDQENYQFASEIAARFLERRSQATLDQILCDPILVAEFDSLAAQITPGFSPLQYRWAALYLRKTKRLRPELLAHVVPPVATHTCLIGELDIEALPLVPGIYIFYSSTVTLYVGECENIRSRIKKHLDHSDIKAIARHFWEHGTADIHLEIHELQEGTSAKVRRALEAELIESRRATFNIKRR